MSLSRIILGRPSPRVKSLLDTLAGLGAQRWELGEGLVQEVASPPSDPTDLCLFFRDLLLVDPSLAIEVQS